MRAFATQRPQVDASQIAIATRLHAATLCTATILYLILSHSIVLEQTVPVPARPQSTKIVICEATTKVSPLFVWRRRPDTHYSVLQGKDTVSRRTYRQLQPGPLGRWSAEEQACKTTHKQGELTTGYLSCSLADSNSGSVQQRYMVQRRREAVALDHPSGLVGSFASHSHEQKCCLSLS